MDETRIADAGIFVDRDDGDDELKLGKTRAIAVAELNTS
jgi:hypothetical protein